MATRHSGIKEHSAQVPTRYITVLWIWIRYLSTSTFQLLSALLPTHSHKKKHSAVIRQTRGKKKLQVRIHQEKHPFLFATTERPPSISNCQKSGFDISTFKLTFCLTKPSGVQHWIKTFSYKYVSHHSKITAERRDN